LAVTVFFEEFKFLFFLIGVYTLH